MRPHELTDIRERAEAERLERVNEHARKMELMLSRQIERMATMGFTVTRAEDGSITFTRNG